MSKNGTMNPPRDGVDGWELVEYELDLDTRVEQLVYERPTPDGADDDDVERIRVVRGGR